MKFSSKKYSYYCIGLRRGYLCYLFILSLVLSCAFVHSASAGYQLSTAEEYRSLGYAEQKKGNINGALTYYTKAANLGLKDASFFNDLGVLYEKERMRRRAGKFYQQAIAIDSAYLPAYMNLAYLYLDAGNENKAVEFFKKRYELGDGNDKWTQRAAKELLILRPEYESWVLHHEAERLNQELVQAAHSKFLAMMERASEHYKVAKKLVQQRKYKKAIQVYDEALRFTPQNPKILQARSEAVIELTRYERRAQ